MTLMDDNEALQEGLCALLREAERSRNTAGRLRKRGGRTMATTNAIVRHEAAEARNMAAAARLAHMLSDQEGTD